MRQREKKLTGEEKNIGKKIGRKPVLKGRGTGTRVSERILKTS